jgi:hypothetical protein
MADRFVLVLAKSAQQAATYARRCGFTAGRYRAVASASSIRGIQVADAHILPEFYDRRDSHAILSEIRWARDVPKMHVAMPPAAEAPAKDQGDGMGEQLSIDDLEPVGYDGQGAPLYEHQIESPQPAVESLVHVDEAPAEIATERAEEPLKKTRRTRCVTCDRLTTAAYAVDPEGHDVETHENQEVW